MMGMMLFTPSLPPRRKMKSSFLPLIPMLPSARARLRNGGMLISEARPRPAAVRSIVGRRGVRHRAERRRDAGLVGVEELDGRGAVQAEIGRAFAWVKQA